MSRILVLGLLLLISQQGAVVHELSHLSAANGTEIHVDFKATDLSCALCPAFAQATTPTFSHSFGLPELIRIAPDTVAAPLHAAIDAAVPRPRSRGPPA